MNLPVSLLQEQYFPVIPYGPFCLTPKHSWRKVLIHKRSTPDQSCGFALRVGYTGNQADAFTIYRLRVYVGSRTVMLPGLFVLQEGFFVTYGEEQKPDEDLLQEVRQRVREAVQKQE